MALKSRAGHPLELDDRLAQLDAAIELITDPAFPMCCSISLRVLDATFIFEVFFLLKNGRVEPCKYVIDQALRLVF